MTLRCASYLGIYYGPLQYLESQLEESRERAQSLEILGLGLEGRPNDPTVD